MVDDRQDVTDGELLAQARDGDSQAFAVLVDRYKDPLIGYLISLVRDRDRAEDLAQESFLRLYERGSNYKEQGFLRAYLFRIATNLLRSEERRKARWSQMKAILFSPNGHRSEPAQEVRLLQDEITVRLRQAIADLPLHYRAPLVLHEIDGWRYREIGEALGCQEGTVKSRIPRGRRLLREELQPDWEGSSA
jgi:RNA polymerase sigma-70 factor (ECF subfamily)